MYEIGIQTDSLHHILMGRKTIEGRLATLRFREFRVGGTITIREDVWQDGKIVSSRPNAARIVITKIDHFPSFRNMLQELEFKHFLPTAQTIDEAIETYARYYNAADEAQHGTLAIHFQLLTNS